MMLIALTGSIGMGKTETLKMFQKRGIPTFDSDQAVHELYDTGGEGVNFIKLHYPEAIKENRVDRIALSTIVMKDKAALNIIESGIHPLVHKKQLEFIEAHKNEGILLFDIPLYFESERDIEFDKVIVVTAPKEVQRERVLKRPAMTEDKFQKILSLQMPDEIKRAKADFIVETHKGFAHAENSVDKILSELAK